MFSQMNPTQSDCSCWRNMSFLIIASLPHSFGAERIAWADESSKNSLKIAQNLVRRMCVLASGLNVVQRAVEVPGNRTFRGQHHTGVIMFSASRQPQNGKSKDSNRRSIQDISWVWTATKLATSQEKQLPRGPLAPTLTSAFLLSLCFLQSFPSWIETFGRLISLHLFQLWCNCGNNSTTVGWKVTFISEFLFFFYFLILLHYGYI